MDDLNLTPNQSMQFVVEARYESWRLDIWLFGCLEQKVSRSLIQRWIKSKNIYSDKKKDLQPNQKIQVGEKYRITVPSEEEDKLEAQKVNFVFLYQDEDLAVIHKPPGLAVHPAFKRSKKELTVAHGLLYLWNESFQEKGEKRANMKASLRPGIVHRLDKDTEGLLLLAKHEEAQKKLMELFASRKIAKEYIAWIWGALSPSQGQIELSIARDTKQRIKMCVHTNGRPAVSVYKTLKVKKSNKGRKFSQVKLSPITGRTHQLRVHMAHHKTPIVGDPLYSRNTLRRKNFGLLLFAQSLSFIHPFSEEKMCFKTDIPQRFIDFERICEKL